VPQERIRTPMLVECGIFSHYIILEWDDEELVEVSIDPEWRAISKSLANGHKEYKLVNGNPVRTGEITFVYSIPINARINSIALILELSSHSKLRVLLSRAIRGIVSTSNPCAVRISCIYIPV
jgi:hypothetical protein